MGKFGMALNAAVCAAALALAGCGGDSSTGSGGSNGGTPTPTPGTGGGGGTPTPTPPTYQTLQTLTGDQTFQTATVTYTDDATVAGLSISATSAQAFGQGTVINFIDASDEIQLTAPGGSPVIRFAEGNVTRSDAVSRTWEINNGSVFDGVVLFNPRGSYSFLGSWAHIEAGQATYRLAVAGIPTQAGDYPATTVTYDIALGGATVNGASTTPVDASRSTGTLTMNFATGQGTYSIELFNSGGTSLGTVTGTIARDATGNGFTGSTNFMSVGGQISGAFFGPQGTEIGFGSVISNSNGTVSYVGLGGGTKR